MSKIFDKTLFKNVKQTYICTLLSQISTANFYCFFKQGFFKIQLN